MSSVPYVAPWATDFRKYSVQTVVVPLTGAVHTEFTVPATQWWRIVSLTTQWSTDANVGNRVPTLGVVSAANVAQLVMRSPAVIVASDTGIAVWMPGGAAYANLTVTGAKFGLAPLPDVLWQYGTEFDLSLDGHQAADTLALKPTLLVEVYTEDRAGGLVPASVAPTPVLV